MTLEYDEQDARKFIKLQEDLTKKFRGAKIDEVREYEERKKHQQPLIDTINELSKRISLEPQYPKFLEHFKKLEITNEKNENYVTLGRMLAEYLNKCDDHIFGLRPEGFKRFIGNTEAKFDNDRIIIGERTYECTEGLLKLLTRKIIQKNDYTEEDYENYKEILIHTDAIYRDNNSFNKYPKASSSKKYLEIIKPIWNELKATGGGLIKLKGTHTQERESLRKKLFL